MSFTLAGQELCVTQGAVSRAIRSLEEECGVSLFVRLPRRLELTEEGRSLWLSVRDALDMLERAVLRIAKRGNDRILTLNVLPTFAIKWLIPRLIEFNEHSSEIEVRLITSIRPIDFDNEDVDLAIRVGRLGMSPAAPSAPRIDLVMTENFDRIRAEELLPDELIPLASPTLLGRNGPIRSADDIGRFTLLHNATRPSAWPDWLSAIDCRGVDPRQGLHFGHFFLALEAAIRGQGIALVPRILAEDDISSGRLSVAIDRPVTSEGCYYLLGRKSHWDVPKIRVFRDWLLETCRQAHA